MSNAKISELRKIFAYTLREEDMLVISLAPDERGGGNETVAVSLGELRKFLQMSLMHVRPITESPGEIADDEELQRRKQSNALPVSGMNAELLKQAIEDAKSVRQTALDNARQAMEEAFKDELDKNPTLRVHLNEKWNDILNKPIGK